MAIHHDSKLSFWLLQVYFTVKEWNIFFRSNRKHKITPLCYVGCRRRLRRMLFFIAYRGYGVKIFVFHLLPVSILSSRRAVRARDIYVYDMLIVYNYSIQNVRFQFDLKRVNCVLYDVNKFVSAEYIPFSNVVFLEIVFITE